MLERLIDLIAPHSCVGCNTEGALLCIVCSLDGFPPLPGRCYRCHSLSEDSRVCETCRKTSALKYVWVRTPYDELAKSLVHKLKFERAKQAHEPIATLMVEALPHMHHSTLMVPIPTVTRRVRQRGYDHAALIAKTAARKTGLRYASPLSRIGHARQVGATRSKRLTQLAEAFYCPRPDFVRGRDIVLVDDIVTTGASIEQAAKTLKQAGARTVSALIFAQKQ